MEVETVMNYGEFTEMALYGDSGYYVKDRERVGTAKGTDFYTSETVGVFGRLMECCCEEVLSEGTLGYDFVHVGVERGKGLYPEECGFREYKMVGVGEGMEIDGQSIVFANELLDAQPFQRLKYMDGEWRELGVQSSGGGYEEVVLPYPSEAVKELIAELPEVDEGVHLDVSLKAELLVREIVSKKPKMVVFIDYGHDLRVLLNECPEGTARGYYQHKQVTDLLQNVGEQDLTCHVVWDRIGGILAEYGYETSVESQEAFLVKRGGKLIEELVKTGSADVGGVKELIHPAHFGQKFQVMVGIK